MRWHILIDNIQINWYENGRVIYPNVVASVWTIVGLRESAEVGRGQRKASDT